PATCRLSLHDALPIYFKKLVRSRMTATGENFTAARAALLESSPVETAPEPHTAGIDPHIERFRTRTLATFMPAGRIISIPTKRRAPRRPPHRGPGGLRGGSDLQREAGQRHPGRLPPGLRAPATRTDRLPAARPRLPHGPVLGEPEPTDSHRFPGTGGGRARGAPALTPPRRPRRVHARPIAPGRPVSMRRSCSHGACSPSRRVGWRGRSQSPPTPPRSSSPSRGEACCRQAPWPTPSA